MMKPTLRSPWELDLLDWSAPAKGDRKIYPDAVLQLAFADSAGAAAAAADKLDGTICANGIVFPAALPVLQMLLVLQPSWTRFARPQVLELLGQICAGESPEGAAGVRTQCLRELRGSLWYFLHGLQFDIPETVWLHVDLLCLLALEFSDLRPKVLAYLRSALTREFPNPIPELIRNTISEIEHSTAMNA